MYTFAETPLWTGRLRTISALIVLLISIQCVAQTETGDSDPPETPPPVAVTGTREMVGTVMNSVTGEPVRRALVQIWLANGGRRSALTDAEGHFQIGGLPDLDLPVTAHKPGFFTNAEVHSEIGQPTMAHPGSPEPLVLQLLPEGVITGHVTTTKGEPVEESPMRILREKIVDGRKRWEVLEQVNCDEDGQYRFGNLMPGKYIVSAGPLLPAYGRVRKVRPEGFGVEFYPGVGELEAATAVNISGGEQLQTDLAIKMEPIFKVAGVIAGISAGMGVEMQFLSRDGDVIATPPHLDLQTGKFEAALPDGNYTVLIRRSDMQGHASVVPLVVNNDVEGITFAIGPATRVPVNIALHTSGAHEPAETIRVAGHELGFSMLGLVPTENRFNGAESQATASEQGPLAFNNLLAGRYAISVTPLAPWYVRSATSGATDLLREDLVISSGRQPDPIDLVLQDDGCGVHGIVQLNGQPAEGAVLLLPAQASLAFAQTSVVTAGAEFYFAGLAPGDYKLLAFDSLDGVEFRNPEVLAPYLSRAVTLTLQSNEVANINVERISTAK